jgi:hypothetical protein
MILNTKQDYLNYLEVEEIEGKKKLQELLDNRFTWVDIAVISDEGTTDETHRVIDNSGDKVQQVLTEDPNSRLYMLGFSVDEVEGLINA